MEDDVIQEIETLIKEYRQRTARIKELGYFTGAMWQVSDGRGHLFWRIRVPGRTLYVRKADFKETRARYHRGQHLKRIGREYLQRINIALSRITSQ